MFRGEGGGVAESGRDRECPSVCCGVKGGGGGREWEGQRMPLCMLRGEGGGGGEESGRDRECPSVC